jgi:AcrR family transcriptional regulator
MYCKLDTMSSIERILNAALVLVRRRKGTAVSMEAIAQAAGLSRQAVYLHFADRAQLMVALVRHAHEKLGPAGKVREVEDAPSGEAALRTWVAAQSVMNPRIWQVARSFDGVRRTDPDAEAAWQDRQKHRHEKCRAIIARIRKEGALKSGLATNTATDLLWTITSLRTWEELVLESGWTAAQYRKRLTHLLVDALLERTGTR